MRALRRLPRRVMVATNGVGVGVVVVVVAVLVAGVSGRQTVHAAAEQGSLRRSVQFAFRRRSATYVTACVSVRLASRRTSILRHCVAYSQLRRVRLQAPATRVTHRHSRDNLRIEPSNKLGVHDRWIDNKDSRSCDERRRRRLVDPVTETLRPTRRGEEIARCRLLFRIGENSPNRSWIQLGSERYRRLVPCECECVRRSGSFRLPMDVRVSRLLSS